MHAVIFANGIYQEGYPIKPGDLVIAADGGGRHCLERGVKVDVVIGDLDSLSELELASLKAAGAKVITYPKRKDYTDLELAIQYALEQEASLITILAGLGGRWDQTLANILLAAVQYPTPLHIYAGNQRLQFIHGGSTATIFGRKGDTVSLIPLRGDAQGVTTQGLEYPLKNEILYFGEARGVSNVMMGKKATIHVEKGLLACSMITNQEMR